MRTATSSGGSAILLAVGTRLRGDNIQVAEPVVVIGGGASGLAAAASLQHLGIAAVVLEQDAAIGGTWARRYDRLRLHTIRSFSGLPHFPIPSRYPRYLSRDDVVAYLVEYARHFKVQVIARVTVKEIRLDEGTRRGWTIETENGRSWHTPVAVVATGQYRRPVVPEWPGRDAYAGQLIHSSSYANATRYAGQQVLVVGAGNSGAEIATDLADGGAGFVAISIRTPPPVVPRDPFGLPVQRTSILLSAFPPGIGDALGRATARLTLDNLERLGLPRANFRPYTTKRIPLIDVGFVTALKRGRVAIKPAVERLTSTGVVFDDGSAERYDAIIAATGFSAGLESLLDLPGVLDRHGEPQDRSGDPTTWPGLYFIGFTHSLRGHLFEANLAARRLARNVRRYLLDARANGQ
jgi:putative flavoprotein involved in K+ transport